MEQQIPDLLPYVHVAGRVGPSVQLVGEVTYCVFDYDDTKLIDVEESCQIEVRFLIKPGQQAQVKNHNQLQASYVTVSRAESLLHPVSMFTSWIQIGEETFVNQQPVDVTPLVRTSTDAAIMFRINVAALRDRAASGVAVFFLSKRLNQNGVRDCVLAAELVSENQFNEAKESILNGGPSSITTWLKCPLSGGRLRTPIRSQGCDHMACFVLDTFLDREWLKPTGRCPICARLIEIRTLGRCRLTSKLLDDHTEEPDIVAYKITRADEIIMISEPNQRSAQMQHTRPASRNNKNFIVDQQQPSTSRGRADSNATEAQQPPTKRFKQEPGMATSSVRARTTPPLPTASNIRQASHRQPTGASAAVAAATAPRHPQRPTASSAAAAQSAHPRAAAASEAAAAATQPRTQQRTNAPVTGARVTPNASAALNDAPPSTSSAAAVQAGSGRP